jgi:hypothetical protein
MNNITNVNNKININCYLIYLEQFENIEVDITNFCEKQRYEKIIDLKDELQIYKLKKSKAPNWKKNIIISDNNTNNDIEEILNYRICVYKYEKNTYYIEINGQLHFNYIFKSLQYTKKPKQLKKSFYEIYKNNKQNDTNKLYNSITYYLNKENYEVLIIELKNNGLINIDINNNDYSYNKILDLYNDLIKNKQINKDHKLIPYNYKDCIIIKNNKEQNSETKYNDLVCETNSNLINLDKKNINGCEITDIYDKVNHYLFHNKKNDDLRILKSQIINGALILKNNDLKQKWINKFNIDFEIPDNFKYIFGIIQKRKNLALKDQLALGNICYILNKMNIEYYIDEIQYNIQN